MAITLSQNSYGKSSVRVAKVTRHADRHDFKEITVNVQLTGAFENVYRDGDNSLVLPTDTMKNTVYALAKTHPCLTIEEFGLELARHFLEHNPQIARVNIELLETLWQRIAAGAPGREIPHPHAFTRVSEKGTCRIAQNRSALSITSGLKDLVLLKTTDSGFSNFRRDQFTTLPETDDRIMATSLEAEWLYAGAANDFNLCRGVIRQSLIETFAQHRSLSVQHTLYAMGEAALEKCSAITDIHLVMPNKHYLLFDLARFGMENRNEIFTPTDEPFGRIEGTVRRAG